MYLMLMDQLIAVQVVVIMTDQRAIGIIQKHQRAVQKRILSLVQHVRIVVNQHLQNDHRGMILAVLNLPSFLIELSNNWWKHFFHFQLLDYLSYFYSLLQISHIKFSFWRIIRRKHMSLIYKKKTIRFSIIMNVFLCLNKIISIVDK